MIKYVLYSVDLDETKNLSFGNSDAPQGYESEEFTIARNNMYDGFIREFSGNLGFVNDIKIWLRSIIDTYGIQSKVNLTKYFFDTSLQTYIETNTAIINLERYVEEEITLSVNYEDSSINRDLKNRELDQIRYNNAYTLNGTLTGGYLSDFEDLILQGIGGNTSIKVSYPFELFNRLLQRILNIDYNPLKSTIFGRTDLSVNGFDLDYDTGADGYFSLWMITKGLLIRNFPLNTNLPENDQDGNTNLVLQFKELFDYFNKKKPLGLGIEKVTQDDGSIRTFVRIEEKNYFYQNDTYSFSLEKSEISDLKRSIAEQYFYSSIKAGQKNISNDNDLGLSEFNNEVEYVTPISAISNTLDLSTTYRSDGTAIEALRGLQYTGSGDQEESQDDEEIFIITAYRDGSDITSRINDSDSGFQSVSGVYGTDKLYTNLITRGSQQIINNAWIKQGLKLYPTDYIRFQKAKQLSKVETQETGSTDLVVDNSDILISALKDSKIEPFIYEFLSPISTNQVIEILANPYLLVKFWNYIDKKYSYGWIMEVSTNLVDKDTNWKLIEAVDIDTLDALYWATQNSLKWLTQNNKPYLLQQ